MQPGELGPARFAPSFTLHCDTYCCHIFLHVQEMSMVLGAFARLRLRDREMMLRIAESTPAILGQFAATDITNFDEN